MSCFCGCLGSPLHKVGYGGSSFRNSDSLFEDDIGEVCMPDEIYCKSELNEGMLVQASSYEADIRTRGMESQNRRLLLPQTI